MTATIILGPKAAAEKVCHDEQMRIWANDLIGHLGLENMLREDMSYDDVGDLERIVIQELRSIIEMAFDHPEARTITRR